MYQSVLEKLTSLNIQNVPAALMSIPVDLLHRGTWQQRRIFSDRALDELAESMATSGGNVVPIIVTPRPNGGYAIIAGERRWRAAQRLGFETLQALVGAYSYEQAAFICAVENLQRENLTPIEEASSYQTLTTEFGLTHDEIARQIGKSRPHVTSYLRLLSLDIRVRDAIQAGRLTYGQARPICTLKSASQQREVCDKAVRLQWSVKRIEQEVIKLTEKVRPVVRLSDSDPDIRSIERAISEATGLECIVKRSPAGQWQVGFNAGNSESFEGLLERLGVRPDDDSVEPVTLSSQREE
ncbi:ParB/RepB/Spo0J family partition protein [Stutzerimonas xanthomarina]|uniref:ParB/RepB/Spo0J family partition protein n=1 Tax=Stutzerimonas xanthomarina TaxID=271420 RepID=A0A427DPK0_9GAMM|nr:ParB/RepB/Spo0J family partition protein [Stutzerimonas xanthomarina]RRV05446.1 ParB/RepB/Spo0J family partition protein [Stutzerimonas xanthomarina]